MSSEVAPGLWRAALSDPRLEPVTAPLSTAELLGPGALAGASPGLAIGFVIVAGLATWMLGLALAQQREPALRLAMSLGSAALLSSLCVILKLPMAVGMMCALAALGVAAVLDAPSQRATGRDPAVARPQHGKAALPLDELPDPAILVDPAGTIIAANAAAKSLLVDPLVGGSIRAFLPDAVMAQPGGEPSVPAHREMIARRRDGHEVPVDVAVAQVARPEGRAMLLTLRDATARARQVADLERLALHDPLTGLPNRALLHDRLDHALLLAQRQGQPMALLMLDLDRFKQVNDTLGHPIGDRLLQAVAPRLALPLRRSDTLARIGGDEFAVLLPPPTGPEEACRVAERIIEALAEPFRIEGFVLDLGISIGVALSPEHGQGRDELIQSADSAMYAAKRGQTGFAVYDAERPTEAMRRLGLRSELKEAIANSELIVHYQPVLDARSHAVAGAEALVRWPHPRHGLLRPDEFLPIAQRGGLLLPLTLGVLSCVLAQQRAWRARGYDLPVTVNIVPRWLEDEKLAELLQFQLRQHDVRADRLILEVAEGHVMSDPARADGVLRSLAAIGCGVALGAFGCGYSSLARLRGMPVTELRIAGPVVEEDSDGTVTRALADLAHGLGLRAVAQGIERAETARRVATSGCDLVQGYAFAPPMDVPGFEAWLDEHPGGIAMSARSSVSSRGSARLSRPA